MSNMTLMPMVIEREGNGERAMDLGSRLLKDRIIMCSGLIDTAMAEIIKMELYYLESEDPTADIKMYINSSGGSIVDGMAIYDAMQYVRPDVCTISMAWAPPWEACWQWQEPRASSGLFPMWHTLKTRILPPMFSHSPWTQKSLILQVLGPKNHAFLKQCLFRSVGF